MSTPQPTMPMPPYQQFQNFYPSGYTVDPAQLLTTNIYESTNKINSNVTEAQRFLADNIHGSTTRTNENIFNTQRSLADNMYESTNRVNANLTEGHRFLSSEIAGVNKNIFDTIAQNAVAIERTAANGMNTTERTAGQVSSAVERSAGQVGASVERNGGNITTAIERVAGEGRLTTTITDAASRQAANDSARDILRAVDRVGVEAVGTTKDGFAGVLSSVERNAGEGRVQTLVAAGQTDAKLLDVRHSILNDVNRSANDILTSNTQSLNVLTKHVTDGAWEQRTAMAQGFQNLTEEHLKGKHDLAQQASTYYASNLLEQQKSSALIANKQDNHFAALLSKQDNHFAAILLEQQKAKECLTLQLQDAKYEALKNKCDLSKELAECCCEIKMKVDMRGQDVINTVDTLDRNRLRDEVNTINNENAILKLLDHGYGHRGHRRRSRSRSRSRSPGRGR